MSNLEYQQVAAKVWADKWAKSNLEEYAQFQVEATAARDHLKAEGKRRAGGPRKREA